MRNPRKLAVLLAFIPLGVWLLFGMASLTGIAEIDRANIEKKAMVFVETFNSANPETLENFIMVYWALPEKERAKAVEKTVKDLMFFHKNGGNLLDPKIKVNEKRRTLFIYGKREQTGAWENFQFRLTGPENKMALAFIGFSAPPATPPKANIESPLARNWIKQRILEISNEQPFYGALLIAKKDDVLFQRAYGMANVDRDEKNTLHTRFNLASGSKMFTALAVAMLIEDGKMALDAPISTYIQDLQTKDLGDRVTVDKLLTHTGGAGDFWDETYEKVWHKITSHRQMLPYIKKNLEPETYGTFKYSNSGYALLALAIENVTGQSFYQFVREEIFIPAKMTSTGFPNLAAGYPQGFAKPYKPQFNAGGIEPGVHNSVEEGARGSGAGGAYSTLGDMFKFSKALMSDKLISSEMREFLFNPVSKFGRTPGRYYGRGFVVNNFEGLFSVGHGGGAPGVNFDFNIYPDLDLVLIMASNFDTIAPREIRNSLKELISQHKRQF